MNSDRFPTGSRPVVMGLLATKRPVPDRFPPVPGHPRVGGVAPSLMGVATKRPVPTGSHRFPEPLPCSANDRFPVPTLYSGNRCRSASGDFGRSRNEDDCGNHSQAPEVAR